MNNKSIFLKKIKEPKKPKMNETTQEVQYEAAWLVGSTTWRTRHKTPN